MKISVAMCTYNGARYLREQLESIAAQTRPPDELVVCDDCSSDETLRVVERFADSTGFPVRLQVNQRTLGSTRNFERAAALCTGDFIALSDQDDFWLPHKLERVETEFQRRPDVGLVFTDAEIVDENLRSLGRRMWDEVGFDKKKKALVRKGRALDVLLPGWIVTGATMAFRSEFRELVLPVPTDMSMIHDGWIALMIATVANVDFIDDPLIQYRQHAQQQVGAPTRRESQATARTKLEDIHQAMHRANSYSDLIKTMKEVNKRLSARDSDAVPRQNLRSIERRLKHLNTRTHLPAGTFGRLAAVLKELLTMRYHEYSNGVSSAAKDLLGARSPKRTL